MGHFSPGPGGGKKAEHRYIRTSSLLHFITGNEWKALGMITTSSQGRGENPSVGLVKLDAITAMKAYQGKVDL